MKTKRSFMHVVGVLVLALVLPLTACDKLLEVTDPDTVNPGTLEDPDFIDVLTAGAIGDFAVAYSGAGGDSYLSVVAVFTDEFFSSGTFTTRTATDRRLQFSPANGNTSDGAYGELHQARRAARIAVDALAAHPDRGTSHPDYQEVAALHAFTFVALGEGFCSSVPISNDENPDPADGPPLTSAELFQAALPLFDQAGGTSLARVGKARAEMNLGNYAAAAALVTGVATTFNYFIEHSITDTRENNPFFNLQANGRYSLSHGEGTNGLAFRGSDPNSNSGQDPRLPWTEDARGGFDPQFRLFVSQKYPSQSSDVALASGVEARLIEAEADLAAGGSNWLTILNTLRTQVGTLMAAQIDNYSSRVPSPSLPALTDPGTPTARVNMIFSERAFWLWGTGHRLGDLRRMVNQYSRTEAQVFPTGAYHKGGTYGTDVVFPVEFEENNNTLYDIGTCVVTSASTS